MTNYISRLALIAVASIFACIAPITSFGWSKTGHMAVAYLAYQKLDASTRARANTLLRLNPFYSRWQTTCASFQVPSDEMDVCLFMMASTWPDQIKADNSYTLDGDEPPPGAAAGQNIGYGDKLKHKYWHYKDLPFSTDGTPTENAPSINAAERIALFTNAIGSSSVSDDVKSYDIAWLLHLVGDVHQPLHATSRFLSAFPKGDRGGNSVTVCFKGKCDIPLHSFWDGIFGDTYRPATARRAAQQVLTPNAALAADPNPDHWINESFKLAKSLVYRKPPIGLGKAAYTLTDTYINAAVTEANKRLSLAGARMANLLNKNLK